MRNFVNCPCASMVVRQNCSNSRPTASKATAAQSLTFVQVMPPGEQSFQVHSSPLSIPLFCPREIASTDHSASYGLPSFPISDSVALADVAP